MKPGRYHATALWCCVLACEAPRRPGDVHEVARELAEIAVVEARDAAQIDVLTERAATLSTRVDAVVQVWRDSRSDFTAASYAFNHASNGGRIANSGFATAISDFQAAERRYRQVTLLMLAVAVSSHLCATRVSTRKFRAELRANGIELRGQDIDHMWPRSLGGVDHPLNYEVLDAHLNRSLGADVVKKFMVQPIGMVQGLAVSALSALSC